MSTAETYPIMPYSLLVGQEQAKLALEISYVSPRVRGVLISGQRGTGKSTLVRAFARMAYGRLPVTLPISATDDRVLGGWKIDELMKGQPVEEKGLLEEADGRILYVDEVNLLENHLVNIILDVASTDILVKQREGIRAEIPVTFSLLGTMNPEEGLLRPQLLDRFGLTVTQRAPDDPAQREAILSSVLAFDQARQHPDGEASSPVIRKARADDERRHALLDEARQRLPAVTIPVPVRQFCVRLAESFQTEGVRGDYTTALAAQACAALSGENQVTTSHLEKVAPLALQHRRPGGLQHGAEALWSDDDDARLKEILQGS